MIERMRTLTRLLAVLVGTLVVLPALSVVTAGPAAAAAPEYRYDVGYNGSSIVHQIPGTAVQFDLAEGEAVYLYTAGLSVTRLTSLIAGDNPGTTFLLRCSGPGLSGLPSGVYSAENMITPGETSTSGLSRWLLVAPQPGRFSCHLAVSSYVRNDVIDRLGGPLRMRVDAGAELRTTRVGAAHPVKAARHWALPDQPHDKNFVLWNGVHRTGGYTYQVSSSAAQMTVVQDVNVTTCIPGDQARFPRCAGAPAYNGSTLKTWIEIQPQHADGSNCAPLIKGTVRRTTVVPARHHKTINDTLIVPKSKLGGCPKFRTSLLIDHVSGAPTVVHATWAAGNAPTYGVAYES